ncbi:MAG: ABC transporter ATP-binding protein [Pseudomonadota bacterium]
MSKSKSELPSVQSIFARLWRDWLSAYRGRFAIVLILMIVIAVCSAGYAQFIQWVIEAFETSDSSVIYWGPLGVLALTLTKGFSTYGLQNLQNWVLNHVQADMQVKMFSRLVDMDLSSLTSESPAALATRFSSDILLTKGAVNAVLASLTSALTIIAAIIYMLSVDALMTLGLLLVFALAFGPVGVIGARIRKLSSRIQAQIAKMTESVNEGLSAIRMVRTYRLEERMRHSAASVFEKLRVLRVKMVKWQAAASPLMEIMGGAAVAVLLVLVSFRLQAGQIDLAAFVGLLTALGVMTSPARRIGSSYAIALQGSAALDRIFALYDTQNIINDGEFAYPGGQKAKGELRFENVSFAYPDGYQALEGINLEIPAGSTFAFVGRSGAGKSTIFNLLPRLYDVVDGAIFLDGRDLRHFSLAALRDQISVVSQESVLLNGSVMENIRFGRSDASDEEVKLAAEQAAASTFIEKLLDGYDTHIDPAKHEFSGGERQRLSIARAILRDAPILLLDEPTSALDAESEAAIREALKELEKGRTTLVIAHRLSTILDSDQIVVLDQGKISDIGTHYELLKREGIYAELFNLQFQQPPRRKRRRGRPSDVLDVSQTRLERVLKYFGAS